ncbi:hypothetical protein BCR44DRAFT_1261406 [Catenaria anguillulae PL171]|uniref:Uncharacterized protein n=1 Tax=Catenaria anguillulae PL171 TaxID=765915 RepID=A0A1Y2HCH5_9FUNG|nr:hypothetical protein BCR44DRAFT_1261406 [Catenaria anguillulae PL171]
MSPSPSPGRPHPHPHPHPTNSHSSPRSQFTATTLVRPTPIVAQRPPPPGHSVPGHHDLSSIEQILVGLDRFASRLAHENQALSHKLLLLETIHSQQQAVSCPRCNCQYQQTQHPQHQTQRQSHSSGAHQHQPAPAPSSPSPDSSFDLVSADDRWGDSHAHPTPIAAEPPQSFFEPQPQTRKDSLSISHLLPATPKSPALNASDASVSLKTMPTAPPTNANVNASASALGAMLSSSPQPAPSPRPPHSPVPSSALAASSLQSLCQDLTRLIWTSTRPLVILDQQQEMQQSADANGTSGAETSMKTKDKTAMTLEEEEIADPVPDIGADPTTEQVAAVLRAAEERLLRLSDMFQQALHDRDILQNHLNSYYHHMAIDRCIRRDAIRNTGAPSNAATANNASGSGDKANPPGGGGGGVGGAPPSPPPILMDPPMSPLGAVSFRVGSYGAGSFGYGRGSGGVGGHDFGGIGGMDSLGGRYIGSAMGRGAEPDAMMQFMHMDDLEI